MPRVCLSWLLRRCGLRLSLEVVPLESGQIRLDHRDKVPSFGFWFSVGTEERYSDIDSVLTMM